MNKIKKIRAKFRLFIDKIKNQKTINFLRKLFRLNGFSYMPSSFTFYLVISIVPLVSLILMILTQFNASTNYIIDLLRTWLPESELTQTIISYLQSIQPSDIVTVIFSSAISFYIASRGIECFTRFADHFYNRYVLDNHFVKRKARSILMTIIFIASISFTIILLVFFENMTKSIIPYSISVWLKYIISFSIFFATISALFYFSPTKRPKFKDILPGAYLSSISILVFIGIFFVYMSYKFDRYNTIYGPLSTIVILLLLVYFCSYILFICFYLNIIIKEKKDIEKMTKEIKKESSVINNKK